MTFRRTIPLLLAIGLLPSCEKVELDPDNPNGNVVEQVRPTSLGLGTQLSPFTVSHILSEQADAGSIAWVCGYVVGSTYRTMNNAEFSASTTYSGNILLSDDSLCTDKAECIAIELSTSAMQKSLSLVDNPQYYRQCVLVEGKVGRYFSQPGIRSAQTGYCLPGFDVSTIDTSPEGWDDKEVGY